MAAYFWQWSGLPGTEDVDIRSESVCNDYQDPDGNREQHPNVIDDSDMNLQESADLDTAMYLDMETDKACCAHQKLGVGNIINTLCGVNWSVVLNHRTLTQFSMSLYINVHRLHCWK